MGQRYLRPRLPWIALEPADLFPQGEPETVVFLPSKESLIGLHIRGLEDHVMLGIREDECGRPISCAMTNELHIDTLHLQSNPRRGDEASRDYGEQ